MSEWNDFFVATAGAAAALTGLLFVGVSISLAKILSIPALPDRALISLTLLLTIAILSIVLLVPKQSYTVQGIEVLIAAISVWVMISVLDRRIYNSIGKMYHRVYLLHVLADQLAILPYIIGGIIIIAFGEAGFYWLVLAIIFSFIKAVLDAWVLLIEINR